MQPSTALIQCGQAHAHAHPSPIAHAAELKWSTPRLCTLTDNDWALLFRVRLYHSLLHCTGTHSHLLRPTPQSLYLLCRSRHPICSTSSDHAQQGFGKHQPHLPCSADVRQGPAPCCSTRQPTQQQCEVQGRAAGSAHPAHLSPQRGGAASCNCPSDDL